MKIGDFVKPVTNTCNHQYVIGKKYRISQQYQGGGGLVYWYLIDPDTGMQGGTCILETDIDPYSINKKMLEDKIKDMEIEMEKNRKMLDYLQSEHKDDVEPTEFFAWYIVQIMESNDPKKTEKISKLLNSVNNNINLDKITIR